MIEKIRDCSLSLNDPLLTQNKPKKRSSALAFVHHVQLFFSSMPTHKTERPQEISHNTQHASPTYGLIDLKDWCKRQFVSGVIHPRKRSASNCLDFFAPLFLSRKKVEEE